MADGAARRYGKGNRLPWWAGYDWRLLRQASSEWLFADALGLWVLLIATLSSLSFMVSLNARVGGINPLLLLFLTVLWWFMIVTLERLVLMGLERRNRWLALIVGARAIVMVMIAVQISVGINLAWGAPEIRGILADKADAAEQAHTQRNKDKYSPLLESVNSQIRWLNKKAANFDRGVLELENKVRRLSADGVCESLCQRATAELDRLRTGRERFHSEFNDNIANLEKRSATLRARWAKDDASPPDDAAVFHGAVAKIRALAELRKTDPEVDRHLTWIFAFALVLDGIALMLKTVYVLSSPRRPYAEVVETERDTELAESDRSRADALREQAAAARVVEIDIPADREIAVAASKKRVEEAKARIRAEGSEAVDGRARGADASVRKLHGESAEPELRAELQRTEGELRALKEVMHERPLNGRYVPTGRIGQGGSSVVLRAHDLETNTMVAVKAMHDEHAWDRSRKRRLRKEWELLNQLGHPNIVRVLDYFEEHGKPYIVMELIDGMNLDEQLKQLRARGAGASWQWVHGMLSQIGDALRAAHERGLVHRDVTPRNVLMSRNGRFYLGDFGAAHWQGEAATGERGTYDFAAPEQLRNGKADARGDVYSLSAIAYLALTGQLPGQDGDESAMRLLEQATDNGVTAAIADVIVRGLSFDPAGRPANAHEFMQLLHAASASSGPVEPRAVALYDDATTVDDGAADDNASDISSNSAEVDAASEESEGDDLGLAEEQ